MTLTPAERTERMLNKNQDSYDLDLQALRVTDVAGFKIPDYDDIVLGYTGSDMTSVVYKKDSITVATLTLTYTGGNLVRVVKS